MHYTSILKKIIIHNSCMYVFKYMYVYIYINHLYIHALGPVLYQKPTTKNAAVPRWRKPQQWREPPLPAEVSPGNPGRFSGVNGNVIHISINNSPKKCHSENMFFSWKKSMEFGRWHAFFLGCHLRRGARLISRRVYWLVMVWKGVVQTFLMPLELESWRTFRNLSNVNV